MIIITAIVTFLIANLIGYAIHYSLHQSWTGNLNKKHLNHHTIQYPANDYMSDVYRDAGKDNTVFTFIPIVLAVIIIPIALGLLGLMTLASVITAEVIILLISFLHNYIHDAFHVTNHILYRLPIIRNIFSRWSYLHWLHHCKMQRNFGIFTFFLDRLFGTYIEKLK